MESKISKNESFNILIHTHKYGNTAYPFIGHLSIEDSKKTIDILVERLSVHFEPDKEETLELLFNVEIDDLTEIL